MRFARLLIALAAVVGTILFFGGCSRQAEPRRLTPEELHALVESGQPFYFLDVRDPIEIETLGTLPGYVNIPLSQLERRLQEVPQNMRIVVACNRAVRARRAAQILLKHGYRNVEICALREYKAKGYPMFRPERRGEGSSKQNP